MSFLLSFSKAVPAIWALPNRNNLARASLGEGAGIAVIGEVRRAPDIGRRGGDAIYHCGITSVAG